MKITKPVDDIVVRMRDFFSGDAYQGFLKEEPFRLDLYSNAQMKTYGAHIATTHVLMEGEKHPDKVLKRLDDNEEVIYKVHDLLIDAVNDKLAIVPASEWFLDNFYLIKEQIALGRKHLPKGYSQTLPILAKGKSAGFPRVYDIALEIIAHSDGRVDLNNLYSFIEAYQTKTQLTLGELWAIPIMLRLAIIENIRRIASRIAIDRLDKNQAIYWSEQLLEVAQKQPKNIIIVIAEMAKADLNLNSAFIAEFTRRLQGKGQGLGMPITWVEQRLSETGQSTVELVNIENQKQAADQVSVRNSIESILLIKTTDWRDFVESVSTVEKILISDKDKVYERMDFNTRDTYRHVVEWAGKNSKLAEHEVAALAIELCKKSISENKPVRQHHVGYFLLDERGKNILIKEAQVKVSFWYKLKSGLKNNRLLSYAGVIIFVTYIISILAGLYTFYETDNVWLTIAVLILSFIAFSQLITILTNWISTLTVGPRPLPKMDYSEGIPVEYSTLVTVPCMLTSEENIDTLVEELEVRYLANTEDNLYFALLTDFTDAPAETMPQDEVLLAYAKESIENLNIRHKKDDADTFFLFHRPRKWNAGEKVWMGYERKRGKLGELNSLLRNAGYDDFSLIVGDVENIKHVKYVITLDADTQLPRESAWKLVAAMAHPLNHAVISKTKHRVVEGYGILQPRTAISLPTTRSSLYARMHSNDSGLDPYTQLVSDVYQDLFYEGSFVGKGIYDVDVFEKILADAFPENRILSHDLLEGSYVRAGLLTDVQLFEEYPDTYWADISRRHRWIRGDWQIAGWALPFVPDKSRKLTRNSLSSLSKWKILDNLRRSLVPIALILLLVLSWTVLPYPTIWTLLFLAFWFLMPLLTAFWHFIHRPKDVDLATHISEVYSNLSNAIAHTIFNIACLPFEAYVNLDAIIRSGWRMFISRRHLLEWTPSSNLKSKKEKTVAGTYLYMWPVMCFIAITTLLIIYLNPLHLIYAGLFLLLWIVSPFIVWWVSKSGSQKQYELSSKKINFLHIVARKTWSYFEEFITEKDNWLPPDNYQEHPIALLAHRTSPTNIGLAIVANLSAYDFGYIGVSELTERTRNTFATLHEMERYKGHFYNWYDTVSLSPLNPRYISTVDSGNFVASIITFRQGLIELYDARIFNENQYKGFADTIEVAKSYFEKTDNNVLKDVEKLLSETTANRGEDLLYTKNTLTNLLSEVEVAKNSQPVNNNASNWIGKLENQIDSCLNDLDVFTPWVSYLPIPEKFVDLQVLNNIPTLNQLYEFNNSVIKKIEEYLIQTTTSEEKNWLTLIRNAVSLGSRKALESVSKIEKLVNECNGFAEVEYNFLYDKPKHLFHIGYNVNEDVADKSYYDMLASEARLGIFTAIAQGKVSQSSWFALGRLITNAAAAPILLSWSGSMFEYLMPNLLMPVYEGTLLERTSKAVVRNQIEFAKKNNIPWGISESAMNLVDTNLNYQYQSFGVPGMGLKRGLGDDLVIAPYATMMALMADPVAACDNLLLLASKNFEGKYGFYEAIDYTASRMPRGQSHVPIKSFMVHHQAMGFLSLAYFLLDQKMQRRFEKDPQFQSAILLLHERVPRATTFYSQIEDADTKQIVSHESHMRVINTPNTPIPEIQLLSNGKYQVAISNAGGGYSRWKDISLTRWREDTTRDNWGTFCYIKDLNTGKFWSNTYQPTLKKSSVYETIFSQGHIEFKRIDEGFETKTDVVVSPEDDVEIRRIKITNRSNIAKTIEVTSYSEVVLATQPADEAHPAFSNLFVQTEVNESQCTIFCNRRARTKEENPPCMFHMMTLNGATQESISFETDRMKFIGRTRTILEPMTIVQNGPLSGTQGSVLDPIASIRYRVTIKPKQTVVFDMVMGIAENREICNGLVTKYQDRHLKNRAFELSWTHSQVLLRQINANESDAQLFNSIASSILYANSIHRADQAIINSNFKGQSGLWSYAISGDLPIILLRVHDSDNIEVVRQLIRAHSYWRMKGLAVDLVVWNEDFGSYRQLLHDQIVGLINATSGAMVDQPGGIFIRSADQISNEDRILFQAVARLIFNDEDGTLIEQMTKRKPARTLPVPFAAAADQFPINTVKRVRLPANLLFNNATGGFTPDGREYVLLVTKNKTSPLPWANVIANKQFGSVVSESGSAYTWAENANSFRLTPWKNDPVSDESGEAFYIRDEESGQYWSATPLPKPSSLPYLIRHGFGYSVYEHIWDSIQSQMWVYIDKELPVKCIVLKLKNLSGRDRRLSVTGYIEWVLGDLASKTSMHVVTEKDPETGVIFIRNRYNAAFTDRIAFFDADGPDKSFTCDRVEFLGRNGSLQNPEAMLRSKLSGKIGAALDPCTAIQIAVNLQDGEEKEVIFKLGAGKNELEAREVVKQFKHNTAVHDAQSKLHDQWNDILDAVQVKTPDAAFNIMTNGWLLYQALACRVWGRSGFYQSGGAFGFRDQLQDVLALMHTTPDISRGQILLAASRQFKEGDVQHWWHPPLGRGVRTTCSDDYLWLPFVTARYIETTGDTKILDEYVSFIEGRPLRPDEESYYDLPVFMNHWETLYNHCKYAISYGLKFGEHGLPLIGSGDWNDGMDKVGQHGKGESVWLGFFLYDVLVKFGAIAEQYGDVEFMMQCKTEAQKLKDNINKNAWDGAWYRRAYFDDGTPLGSSSNEECRIDSISQSWSVLSGAGLPDRTQQAMQSLDQHLINRDYGIIKLLDPPFDKGTLYPGYIKGYVPGVRENGGQYTHAAVWATMAFAAMKDGEKVWELFSMINPVHHTQDEQHVRKYKVEPYVMAADVYGVAPHEGRGGWTWYTGSAGWTYQLALEYILGLKRKADKLYINPCIPDAWGSFEINYRFEKTNYQIIVHNKDGNARIILDGIQLTGNFISLQDDTLLHKAEVYI